MTRSAIGAPKPHYWFTKVETGGTGNLMRAHGSVFSQLAAPWTQVLLFSSSRLTGLSLKDSSFKSPGLLRGAALGRQHRDPAHPGHKERDSFKGMLCTSDTCSFIRSGIEIVIRSDAQSGGTTHVRSSASNVDEGWKLQKLLQATPALLLYIALMDTVAEKVQVEE